LSTLLREALLPLAALALCPLAAHLTPLNAGVAVDHARAVAALETRLGLHVEPVVAGAVANEGWLAHPIAVVYLLAHLPVTVAVLGWVLLKRPYAWPVLQKIFVLSQGATIALNVAWPCAPPSRIGVANSTAAVWGDGTMDAAHVLQHPFAAMPSGHVAFALIAGGAVAWLAPRPWQRLAGLSWPVTTATIIVITGNHFWLDAAAAVPVTGLVLAVALLPSMFGRARAERLSLCPPIVGRPTSKRLWKWSGALWARRAATRSGGHGWWRFGASVSRRATSTRR
jgi:hypothetical protein